MTIEQQVKHHRLSLGLEIRQFADKIGVDVSYVSYYELGLKRLGNKVLDRINAAYGTDFKVVKECIGCGQVFKPYPTNGAKRCDECLSVIKRYDSPKQRTKQAVTSIAEFNRQAREQGLTYGQLQKMKYIT